MPGRTVRATAALALALSVALPATASAAPHCASITEATNPDWMAALPDGSSLAQLSIPGTHQSLSLHGGDLTQTQENHGDSAETLTAQLRAGIRAIDIRVRRYDDLFTLHHGPFYQNANFADVLREADEFLAEHPGEVVLMRLKAECTGEIGSCADHNSSLDVGQILDRYRREDPHGGVLYDPAGGAVPTLGEVRGKVVLAVLQNAHGGLLPGRGLGQFTADTWDEYVQDRYEVPTVFDIDDKWFAVRDHLARTAAGDPSRMFVNFSSGSSPVAHPNTVACGAPGIRGVNDYALEHLTGQAPSRTGVVLMDFPGAALVNAIIAANPDRRAAR
ncbi:1-phosphatidylinositol phosphodiesterase [Saccharopolyspora subtropica]|uniref:1-phosphatidylinositol phosphodiesterase n=1 Tax=Saccharopolyspora thermophila TaxID=89367 RepID=A0A917NBD6_9PSEU|nr:phosphatidylinositol-specific phospholipase C [Saccharopolyspora subtropica]GGI85449.1 1-phosphatidylinositol phosphodiesterase [Saccharopolyspora subtropica]